MTTEEKMIGGELYRCDDGELMKKQAECLELLYDYNATRPSQGAKREELLSAMFAEIGAGCHIELPLHAM